ncbi:beta-propeller fold lactonase family protein, partial [Staphylococcus epidermidis]|uniref:beta-propeller fold lactonase family protein n=1 Tax=Staphylococcus epidermidis TaxID=1282 RepID=UPI0011A9BB3F
TKQRQECRVPTFNIKQHRQLQLINRSLPSNHPTASYIQLSTNPKYLFQPLYPPPLPTIYKLNQITPPIHNLIQQLPHQFPTPSHQTQHSSHLHFLNQTPHHNYVL